MKPRLLLFLIVIYALLTACTPAASGTPTPMPLPSEPPTIAPTDTPLPSPTATPLAPLVVLLRPADADPALADPLEDELRLAAETRGMRWQVRPALTASELPKEVRLLAVLAGSGVDAAAMTPLIAAAPQAQIFIVGVAGLEPAANLITVQFGDGRPDRLGFIAGFIAAMITPDYRSGMVGLSGDIPAQAAYRGFINGDTYYCGLCLQSYPPYYNYPLYVEAPAGTETVNWWGNGEFLKDHQAKTVFIYPGAGDDAMLLQLAEGGLNLIGTTPPPEALRANWVASLRTDPLPTVLALIPQLFDGQSGQVVMVPLQITDVNEELLSTGRLRYANEVLADLMAGFTDTGVDPETGEFR